MNFDAIDAASFKGKTKVIFLYIKSGIVSLDGLRERCERKKEEIGVDIFPKKSVEKIENFYRVYKRYVNFLYARKLQEKCVKVGEKKVKGSLILGRLRKFDSDEIILKFLTR